MRFFLDTADLDKLRKGASWAVVDGVGLDQFIKDWGKVFHMTPVAG